MVPGLPFIPQIGCSALITGETGGGRSSLVHAGLYDAARADQRCLYIGDEVTADEFNARTAVLMGIRGHKLTDDVPLWYGDVNTVLPAAWAAPKAWIDGIAGQYDVIALDPLSSVAAALDHDYESNSDYVAFYSKLVQPLVERGIVVILIDNIGHSEDARHRAKGASAKQDKADLRFTCIPKASPEALILKAKKVRSVRADIKRGDEWIIAKDTQELVRVDASSKTAPTPTSTFRPTFYMEKISQALEDNAVPMSVRMVNRTVKGKDDRKREALDRLVEAGYVTDIGTANKHEYRLVRPYREGDEDEALPGVAQVLPDRRPATVQQVLPAVAPVRSTGQHGATGSGSNGNSENRTSVALAELHAMSGTIEDGGSQTTIIVPDPLRPNYYTWEMNA
jgi:hypothetical protein